MVTAQDAQNALKGLFAETLQEMLDAELNTHLSYEKHASTGSRRSRFLGICRKSLNRSLYRSIKRT
ncbi:hypothetical protein ABEW30_27965 [Paenibacillus lautus]